MSQQERPAPGQKYRHFKGHLYQIITIGYHSETKEEMVVYQALYGDFQVYIRPLSMFMEPVDRVKYPNAEQVHRFERVESVTEVRSGAAVHSNNGETLDTNMVMQSEQILSDADHDTEEVDGVNPLLVKFLDAETYTEKLKIYLDMRDSIDEVILTDVAASLDIAAGDGTLEEQYESVQYALHTLARYERSIRE
jgi:hypothetical protein